MTKDQFRVKNIIDYILWKNKEVSFTEEAIQNSLMKNEGIYISLDELRIHLREMEQQMMLRRIADSYSFNGISGHSCATMVFSNDNLP